MLAGGRSSRLGRDKALLEIGGRSLLERVAEAVREAAGSVTLVGNPELYGRLGYEVIPDPVAGAGPLAGIAAALERSRAEWNLVVACDLPEITAGFLSALLYRAAASPADCCLPAGPSGLPEPLCAAYRKRCLPAIRSALDRGVRKVTEGLAGLALELWKIPDISPLRNINTREEWESYLRYSGNRAR